jgi:hypothetical protein
MAFEYAQDGKGRFQGGVEFTFGRWTNGAADLGGDILTGGAVVCDLMLLSNTGSAVEVTASSVNEEHPGPTTHTIVNGTGDDGVYLALVR